MKVTLLRIQHRTLKAISLLEIALVLVLVPSLFFAKVYAQTDRGRGVLVGLVVDKETREPLAWTALLITELNRSAVAHEDGRFRFLNLPPGEFSLKCLRLGYQTTVYKVAVMAGDTAEVLIEMASSPLTTETVVVVARSAGSLSTVIRPEEVFAGRKLQQQLGRTIAETLNNEPGIAQRTMGPAPARPVIRGLGGDRLLILEDGGRTGDLSATSSDHALAIDPMTSERIEVIRGPAALVYGPNTLGGVINVVRGQIPSNPFDHWHGQIGLQGESVNDGISGSVAFIGPVGPFVMRVDGIVRRAEDIGTPRGALKNSDIHTRNGSFGVSNIGEWGYGGVSINAYRSKYGLPGGFVGAHPFGVRIDMRRTRYEGRLELLDPLPLVKRVEVVGNFTEYFHQEFEADGSIGTEFGVQTYHAGAMAFLDSWSMFSNGIAGVWSEYRDFAAGGFIFTPPTKEYTIASFLYEEVPLNDLTIQAAVRFDLRVVDPGAPRESRRIGTIARRTFANFSAGLSAIQNLNAGWFGGMSLMRSFRAPGIEELYSEGPHLAAYSFEVGNPTLQEEVGFGAEVFLRHVGASGRTQFSLFRNDIAGYIFPRNTGQINARTLLPVYQYSGRPALMYGGELAFDWQIASSLSISGTVSYVHGTLKDTRTPMAMMPPLNGKLNVRWNSAGVTVGAILRGATRQDRVDEFEEPTAGYLLQDAYVQYQIMRTNILHTVVMTVENLTNQLYRMHLSRVKSVMPEPGRNFKLYYRLFF
jgi:iron complex outermembrane receptor protein